MGREFELNVDFDLGLRRRPPLRQMGELKRQISEMAWHVLFVGRGDDSVRVPGPVPEEFLAGLQENGLTIPELTVRPAIRREQRFTPFGWSRAAIELNDRYGKPSSHPGWEVVRRVNSRDFARSLEVEIDGGETPIAVAGAFDEVEEYLKARSDRPDGWVVKADHGNSGLGNRRLRTRELGDRDREWLERLLEEDDRVLIEPWHRRVHDLGVFFDLREGGGIGDLVIHEVVNTAEGAFIGAIYDSDSTVVEPWRGDLTDTADAVAKVLHREGYFGPVNLDAFVWERDGEQRLRPLVDLNARSNMSWAARRLWDSWDRSGVAYWRLFTRRRLKLPTSFEELAHAIGVDRFENGRRRGVLATSPLWVLEDGRQRSLFKLGVLFAAATRREVMAQERRFRDRFDR